MTRTFTVSVTISDTADHEAYAEIIRDLVGTLILDPDIHVSLTTREDADADDFVSGDEVERVAQIMCKSDDSHSGFWSTLPEDGRNWYRRLAVAALTAAP